MRNVLKRHGLSQDGIRQVLRITFHTVLPVRIGLSFILSYSVMPNGLPFTQQYHCRKDYPSYGTVWGLSTMCNELPFILYSVGPVTNLNGLPFILYSVGPITNVNGLPFIRYSVGPITNVNGLPFIHYTLHTVECVAYHPVVLTATTDCLS